MTLPPEMGFRPRRLGVIGTNWEGGYGYYMHAGYMCLWTSVSSLSDVDFPVTTTLMEHIPPEARPSSDVTQTMPVIVAEYATPGIPVLPTEIDVTVTTSGTVTIASLPPHINDVPLPSARIFNDETGSGGVATTTCAMFNRPVGYEIVL